MKSIVTILAGLLTFSTLAADTTDVRTDIDKDIPLVEGVRRANERFPDAQPLTEDEVIAAVRAIKLEHRDIRNEVHEAYMRVVNERVLPKGMYFSRITSWSTPYGQFRVDWKDLTLRGRPATPEETKKFSAERSKNVSFDGPILVGGFNYRIRARFISSQPPNESGAVAIPTLKK